VPAHCAHSALKHALVGCTGTESKLVKGAEVAETPVEDKTSTVASREPPAAAAGSETRSTHRASAAAAAAATVRSVLSALIVAWYGRRR